MTRKPDYISQRGKSGIWYVRLRVPSDLAEAFGKSEFIKSTKTTDERTARKLARATISDWEKEFEKAREKPELTTVDAETIARYYYHKRQVADLEHRDTRPVAALRGQTFDSRLVGLVMSAMKSTPEHLDPLAILNDALSDIKNLDLSSLDLETRQTRLNELRKHLSKREYTLIAAEASQLIDDLSLPITRELPSDPKQDSPEFIRLCDRMMRAEIEFLERQNERDKGDFRGSPQDPMLQTGTKKLDLTTFNDIIDEREKRSNRGLGGTVACSTLRKYRTITKEFADWRQSTRAATVKKDEVERWRDKLMDDDAARKTVRDKVSCIKAVLAWGQNQSDGKLFTETMPLALLELPELGEQDSSARTYTIQQALTVLCHARSQKAPFKRWVPWILAYSGARVSEALQLTKADFFNLGDDWFYEIRHLGERTTKTKRRRTVPVHPALIEEGLIKFVSSIPNGKLFVDLRMDGNLRDWIREVVLPDLPEPKPGPNHGFRHLFEDLRLGAIETEAAHYITGRASTTSAAGYGKSRAMLPALAQQMAKFPRFIIDEKGAT